MGEGTSSITLAKLDTRQARARKIVWDFIDTQHPHVWDDPVANLTDEIAAACQRLLYSRTKEPFSRPDIVRWITRSHVLSPWLDEVAIERAMQFEWSVLDALTAAEREVVVKRLARMKNPFEDPDEHATYGHLVWSGGLERAPRSKRRIAYDGGSDRQRDTLRAQVRRARARAAKAAA